MKDAALKRASEAALVTMFPFLIYDFERNILIRWACGDFENACFGIRRAVWLNPVRWSLRGVDEVWIEDVKLVPLDKFWRRI